MKKRKGKFLFFIYTALLFMALLLIMALPVKRVSAYNTSPPFKLTKLKPIGIRGPSGKMTTVYEPKHPYEIMINYELGMHCVGFDISYCCVIPPYNSIQAQAIKTGENGMLPLLLSPKDNVSLYYHVRNNSYSEGNKMDYWGVQKQIKGESINSPGNNMANYVWNHLFIYKNLNGTIPKHWTKAERLYVGKNIQVPLNSGPTGQNIAGGYMTYSGSKGGDIVFTDSLIPAVQNVPLTLTSSYLWDALGLPLTAFYDSRVTGNILSITTEDFQPYQYAVAELRNKNGKPIMVNKKPVKFFGTDPVDMPNCYLCHSGNGEAAVLSKKLGLTLFGKEYTYWKKNGATNFMARLKSASIDILELHDKFNHTHFLKDYNPNASSNRLGTVGSVNCADCHGDNVDGNLQEPRPMATGYKTVKALPLAEAIHMIHQEKVPMPDAAGRTQSCQACHPTHWQLEKMNIPSKNPFAITNNEGIPRFSKSDVRIAGGGCYLRRDAHANPDVAPPFFLNAIGKWYFKNVSMTNAKGQHINKIRGLYCTDCHNLLSQTLYKYDNLSNVVTQKGKTLRNKSIREIIKIVAGGNVKRFKYYFADPRVGVKGNPLVSYYKNHIGATIVRALKNSKGKLELLPWNAKKGGPVPYDAASAGSDWWLAAGEPHCADCHIAPFVESQGGHYFPIDQPDKYSLYRYSKAHGDITCQGCHESIHGLYPVRYNGPKGTVDLTTYKQALQFSPNGKYAGPVTCAACHTVNKKGVPTQLMGTKYYNDYWASVVLLHFMRSGDQKLPIKALVKKYPYWKSREIAIKGWK
jgi:hypothetical protein